MGSGSASDTTSGTGACATRPARADRN
jgi:hypothetical protein